MSVFTCTFAKKRLSLIAFILHALTASQCFGGVRERVAVAEAVVWANQHIRPDLPNDLYQKNRSLAGEPDLHVGPTPLTTEERLAKQLERFNELLRQTSELEKNLTAARERLTAASDRIAELKLASGSADRSGSHPSASLVPPDGAGGLLQREWLNDDTGYTDCSDKDSSADSLLARFRVPMRLELPKIIQPFTEPAPRAQLVVESTDGCGPCARQKHDINTVLGRLGWDIGEHSSAQIRYINGTDETTYPRITLYKAGAMLDRWYGYQDPGFLSQRLRAAWDSVPEPAQTAAATVTGGTIHARGQIRQANDYFRKYIGEANTLSVIWNRPEGQFNLLAGDNLQLKDLWGLSGRIQVDAPNAINLPVKSFATAYQLLGEDLRLSPESFTINGFVNIMRFHFAAGEIHQTGPSRLLFLDDSLLIYSVCQMIHAIVELLHPSADIILPDQIVCHACLVGETLTINFDKSPNLCLKWLFTFNLAVKRAVITDSNVQMEFTGSRFVKSCDFEVR